MAGTRAKAPAIGTMDWILDERRQAMAFTSEELEDFSFAVRNDLEWLNEHMAEILAGNGQ